MYIRVGKIGSLRPWSRVIFRHVASEGRNKLSGCHFAKMIPQCMGESFWQKKKLLQYTMTLLQGPKDPDLPNLTYITLIHVLHSNLSFVNYKVHLWIVNKRLCWFFIFWCIFWQFIPAIWNFAPIQKLLKQFKIQTLIQHFLLDLNQFQ